MTKPEMERMMASAGRENAARDQIDHTNEFAVPNDCTTAVQLDTINSALDAAPATDDWNCVAEAKVMLEDALKRARANHI